MRLFPMNTTGGQGWRIWETGGGIWSWRVQATSCRSPLCRTNSKTVWCPWFQFARSTCSFCRGPRTCESHGNPSPLQRNSETECSVLVSWKKTWELYLSDKTSAGMRTNGGVSNHSVRTAVLNFLHATMTKCKVACFAITLRGKWWKNRTVAKKSQSFQVLDEILPEKKLAIFQTQSLNPSSSLHRMLEEDQHLQVPFPVTVRPSAGGEMVRRFGCLPRFIE